jgi:hypothetical protein
MTDRATCETCRFRGVFYVPADRPVTTSPTYKCHRNAPVATGGMYSPSMTIWATVRMDDWCGEHQSAPDADRG